MTGFLESYGKGEERREKIVRRTLLALLAVAVVGGTAWFFLRNYRENRQAERFFELLRARNYPEAYRLWGCSVQAPCPNYRYEKFLEDWGPKSPAAQIDKVQVSKTRSCPSGVIKFLRLPDGQELLLWVDRKDLILSYAPWPVCHPRMASTAQPAS